MKTRFREILLQLALTTIVAAGLGIALYSFTDFATSGVVV